MGDFKPRTSKYDGAVLGYECPECGCYEPWISNESPKGCRGCGFSPRIAALERENAELLEELEAMERLLDASNNDVIRRRALGRLRRFLEARAALKGGGGK